MCYWFFIRLLCSLRRQLRAVSGLGRLSIEQANEVGIRCDRGLRERRLIVVSIAERWQVECRTASAISGRITAVADDAFRESLAVFHQGI